MLDSIVGLLRSPGKDELRGIAIGVGQRHEALTSELLDALARIGRTGKKPFLVFLTADPHVILQRYATTRRPHPLERAGTGLEQAVLEEALQLKSVREAADMVIDTTAFSIHDLRRSLQEYWSDASSHLHGMKINLLSFGYKYGVPREADLVFDVRFLPNPYFVDDLKHLTGQDQQVTDYIFKDVAAQEFKRRCIEFLSFILPLYDSEGRYRLSIAFGCTGGRHRSVAMALAVEQALGRQDYAVSLAHRNMELG
jgi:UPF0042 nucleotide-binding protein